MATLAEQAEQALRDSEARLRAVVDTAVDGIVTIDERGVIEWLNRAALRIFGYEAAEIVGQNVKVLMPEPYRSGHDGYLTNYLTTGEKKIIGIGREVVGLRKDGSTFPMDLAVSEVQLAERRLFTGIVRDITQRKAAEREVLAAKEAAETASRAKDQFIAAVSHELRTPLNPILAVTGLLQAREDLPADVKEDLEVIRRNAEQEARLVDDLLNLTRLARGKIELHPEVVDVHRLLRLALGQFDARVDERRITVSVRLGAARPHVWADPGRLQQVLSNLLDSAVKFTGEGGTISVRTSNVVADDASDGDAGGRLRVEVIDSGIGIEPDVLPRLFNPFEQGEKSVTREYGGLGLGLVISKGIVDLHEGTLRAESAGRGRGATFTLELPVMAAAAVAAATSPAAAGPARAASRVAPPPPPPPRAALGLRILLVEDHADTLKLMARLLRGFGCTVTPAASVHEAIEAAGREHFDLLVSDIGLPDGSGLDVMRQLARTRPIKGIAVSGYGQEDDLRRSREAGFVEHLVKPIDLQALREAIQKAAR